MKIFNNFDVVTKGWYIACSSQEILLGQAKSIELCGQKIVLFRGEDGKVNAMDAYCPHLGTDLGIGKVDGNYIRCFFHHWAFDGSGKCQDIPCQNTIPKRAKLQAYATDEKYGFIWVYPDIKAPKGVVEFNNLKGKNILSVADRAFTRNCHHHICMMNGIDAQHLRTVHKINIEMDLKLQQNSTGNIIDFTLSGEFPNQTFREKIGRKILGDRYEYTMRYADGCIGLLTIMKNVKLLPQLYMIYAYIPLAGGKTRIQPIYITEKRPGIWGNLVARFLIFCTKLAYYMLRDEDGKVYDNIRFNPNLLLDIDAPLTKYIEYVNQLKISLWSKIKPERSGQQSAVSNQTEF